MEIEERLLSVEKMLEIAMKELAMCRKGDKQVGAATSVPATRKGGLSEDDKAKLIAKRRAVRARSIQRIKNKQ